VEVRSTVINFRVSEETWIFLSSCATVLDVQDKFSCMGYLIVYECTFRVVKSRYLRMSFCPCFELLCDTTIFNLFSCSLC
jgi:hypothetical protein